MNYFKRLAAGLMAAVMVFSLAACGGGSSFEEDLSALVQGNLDEIYLGQFSDEYMELVGTTEAECQESYELGIQVEAQFFVRYFNIEYPTDELMGEIEELYKEIYSHSKYVVNAPSKLDESTYALKLQISPINVIELVDQNWDAGMADFYARYADTDPASMSEEEYMAYDNDWARAIIAMFYEQMPNLGYRDEESIAIQIIKDDDNIWSISDSDLVDIDELILFYP